MSSIAEPKRLVAEQVGRDRVPWSTGRYCEKPDPGPPSDRTCAGKSLILRDARVQIPYATEQGNKSDEQGDKIDNQGIKSAEHGTARQVSSGRRWRPVGTPAPARRAPGAQAVGASPPFKSDEGEVADAGGMRVVAFAEHGDIDQVRGCGIFQILA
jgi:hypothetical protein